MPKAAVDVAGEPQHISADDNLHLLQRQTRRQGLYLVIATIFAMMAMVLAHDHRPVAYRYDNR